MHDEACGITGEALKNAFTRSAASRIEVEIIFASTVFSIRVRDDGVGIQDKGAIEDGADDWRLIGMRDRALAINGDLKIWSRPAEGTEIELSVAAATAYEHSAAINI